MERFTAAIRKALNDQNWFGALFVALAIPEICGAIETPDEDAGKRYKRWFKENLEHKYAGFLTAEDCYTFRKACLYQGLSELERRALTRIHFIVPTPGSDVHKSLIHHTLHLQIDLFCLEICEAAEEWLKAVRLNKEFNRRMASLIRIRKPSIVGPIMV